MSMSLKAFVAAALGGISAERKLAMACDLTGKDVNDYSHLDNGRKSMWASNTIRALLAKDHNRLDEVRELTGMLDLEVDFDADTPAPASAARSKESENALPTREVLGQLSDCSDPLHRPGFMRVGSTYYVAKQGELYFS